MTMTEQTCPCITHPPASSASLIQSSRNRNNADLYVPHPPPLKHRLPIDPALSIRSSICTVGSTQYPPADLALSIWNRMNLPAFHSLLVKLRLPVIRSKDRLRS
jgi:hypothetical protein